MGSSPDRMVAGLIGDRYEITGLIASGGMGSVYRARDTILDRTVAVKVLKAGGDDPDFVARFKSEATNAARLSHPNIVQVFDFGYADGQPYMAMEYVDGQNLREILSSRTVLRPDLAARIALQVASALEHARRNGLMHRDVKPENILITTEGIVKVADFGLSRAFAESKATQGVLLGTAAYLAPEQVEGGAVDHRADIYALGIVLFEMLTGKTPFDGDSAVVIAYKRVAEDVPSAMSINPGVPRELDIIIARATVRQASGRYGTAGMMAEALRDVAPRSDTGDIGGLVHHTQAIPIVGEETIAVIRRDARGLKRNVKRRRRIVLFVALALLASAIYAVAGRTPKIDVPSVKGLQQDVATARLEKLGFRVDARLENSSTVPVGAVISQIPDETTTLAKGSTVIIKVSAGPALVQVPSVKGMLFSEAEQKLKGVGFTVRRVDVFDDTVKRLHVISQDPNALLSIEKGTPITLTVSKGPEKIKIPDVIGDPKQSAIDDLTAAGFKVEVKEQIDAKIPADHVISVDPKVGTQLAKGETVTLVISTGPPPVKVPNLLCMTRAQAEDALRHVGLVGNFTGLEGSNRKVVDQKPVAKEEVPKGSTVNVVMGYGATC